MQTRPITRFVLAAALVLAAPLALAAPPSDAQVDRLLTVMRARETVQAILPQVQASQQQMVQQVTAGQPLSDEQRQRLDRLMARSGERTAAILSWDKLQPLYRDIYRQTFTGEDMDAMIAFYSSAAGRNLLDKMPQLMQNTMTAMQTMIVPMLQDMQKDIEAETASASAGSDTGKAGKHGAADDSAGARHDHAH